ncbi:helix-turn-helix domain-containing protein [Leifsonia shinshuensis]|uniref:Cupin domain-containing protein n=1 Tax=Leifsonia shinshuensis TaxID=150026 RepID=A0A7G6YAS5_9MICO|nr:cupin domain-containing protein [Leifsonia shinshuensis]QNE35590.1 cupin domain-containing protein [Leifsonia shinshuensis]
MANTESGSLPNASLEVILEGIGDTVRARRKARGLTLSAMTERTGLSTAIISQIERGLANPSFTTLAQLAHGLDIPVGELFAQQPVSRSPVVRKSERRDLLSTVAEARGRTVFELLSPDLHGTLEAIWVETPPGHDSSGTPFTHRGEEFGLIISGRKEVYVDGEQYVLEEGDSITFNSTVPHWYKNTSDEVCRAIWVISPPSW